MKLAQLSAPEEQRLRERHKVCESARYVVNEFLDIEDLLYQEDLFDSMDDLEETMEAVKEVSDVVKAVAIRLPDCKQCDSIVLLR